MLQTIDWQARAKSAHFPNRPFIDGAYEGELVEAMGEVVRAGKSLIFVRGQISTGDRILMTYSGVIRKFTPRG